MTGRNPLHGKRELIAEVAEIAQIPRPDVAKVLDALADSIELTLQSNGRAKLPRIGILDTVQKPARSGTGPDGTLFAVPARRYVRFRAVDSLRDILREPDTTKEIAP